MPNPSTPPTCVDPSTRTSAGKRAHPDDGCTGSSKRARISGAAAAVVPAVKQVQPVVREAQPSLKQATLRSAWSNEERDLTYATALHIVDDKKKDSDNHAGRPKGYHPGKHSVEFGSSKHLADDALAKEIGWKTQTIRFGCEFKLTNEHIDRIIALGPSNIQEFIFAYSDVNYRAHNDAMRVTSDGAVRLASACPKLVKVQLQATENLGDAPVLVFLEKCPNLKELDITPASGRKSPVSKEALQTIREHPEWAPKLRKLRIEEQGKKPWMKEMRELSKVRPLLKIELVRISEEKKWGDWELVISSQVYQKGKKLNLPYWPRY